MEKYTVVENKTQKTDDVRLRELYQDLVVCGPNGVLRNRNCHNFKDYFKPGDVINVYKTKSKDSVIDLEVACSYKLGDKYYVDLARKPIIVLYGGIMVNEAPLRDFYKDVSFMDSVRLNRDIARVLWQRGILPSISRINNLRMFLQDENTLTL